MVEGWLVGVAAALAAVGVALLTRRRAPGSTRLPPQEPDRSLDEAPSTDPAAEPGVGEVLGGYRLEERLDHGGTAIVFRGVSVRQPGAQPVAVKVVHMPDLGPNDNFLLRFEREVQILRGLHHPGIIQFLGAGEEHGRLFLIEELAPSGTLRRLMEEGGMAPARFLQYFLPMVEAVAYAHGQGVIHRDLKPENVLLMNADQIKITDFGLAKSEYLGGFTTTATTLGTPIYMSPEQCAGRPATPASDQYSLGIIGYEMLIGSTPFFGASIVELMEKHLYEAPAPLSQLLKHPVPAAIETVLMRMLAKDPRQRFASLAEVADGLRQAQGLPVE